MKRTLCAALILVCLGASACKKREPANARIDAALATLLPGDTAGVACLRLDRLKGTPFYEKFVAGKRIPALEEFAARTGLDPRESVYELLLSTNGKRSYLFIRGKFGGEFGFEPEIKMEGVQRSSYKGHYLLYSGDAGVLFMNSGAAIAGKVSDLKQLVDGFDSPNRATPEALFDLVATLPGTAQVWAASLSPSTMFPDTFGGREDGSTAANLMRAGRRVTRLRMWGDLSQGLELHAQATAASEPDAEALRDTFKAAIGMARLSTKDSQQDMLRVYDGVSASSTGAELHVDVKEPFDLIEQVIEELPFQPGTKRFSPGQGR
jgi:hypothetical protein